MAKTAFPFRRRSTPSKPSQLSRLLFFLAFVFVSFLFCSRNATGFGFHLSSDAHCARRYRTDVSLILSSETRRRGVCSSSSVVFYFLPFSVFLLFFSHPALSIFISFSSFVCLIFFFLPFQTNSYLFVNQPTHYGAIAIQQNVSHFSFHATKVFVPHFLEPTHFIPSPSPKNFQTDGTAKKKQNGLASNIFLRR